jgi:hypothetical protein
MESRLVWSWVPWDSEQRITVLARTSNNLAIIQHSGQLTILLSVCIVFCPRPVGLRREPLNEELRLSYTLCADPVLKVLPHRPIRNLEPANSWWYSNRWFGAKKRIPWRFPSLVVLNPTAARDPEEHYFVPTGQDTNCLSTFPDRLRYYPR